MSRLAARVFITGGSGYLGQTLVPAAAARHEVCFTYFTNPAPGLPGGVCLDVRDGRAVRDLILAWRPDVIIHTVGSNRQSNMGEVIVQGTTHVAAAAAEASARLIHLSSDAVFDGRQGPYRESDPRRPIHAYGRAKAAAEQAVAHHPNHVIVRTSLIYGFDRMDLGTTWMAQALAEGRPVTLFTDQWRNPVWVESLSQACLELVALDYCGILHVAGEQALSRAEFGQRLLEWWNVPGRQQAQVGLSSDEWPHDCRLDISLARQLLQTPLPGVDEVLALVGRTSARP